MREACGEAHLKVILAVGECGSLTTVYQVRRLQNILYKVAFNLICHDMVKIRLIHIA